MHRLNKLNATKIGRLQSGIVPLVELLVEFVRTGNRVQANEEHVTDQGGRSERPEHNKKQMHVYMLEESVLSTLILQSVSFHSFKNLTRSGRGR
jgi:hypothetical protein